MTPSLAPDFTPEIQVVHDRLTTTSLAVSKTFGKDHKNVLRDIQNLECPKDFHALNFEPMFIEVKIGNGAVRKDPAFLITRDGFTILAMGFTGKRAMEFKIKYIEAFNRMEEDLRRRKENPAIPPDPFITPTLNLTAPIDFRQNVQLRKLIDEKIRILPEPLHQPAYSLIMKALFAFLGIRSRKDLTQYRFEEACRFVQNYPLVCRSALPETAKTTDIDLDFPKDTARPSHSFWKDLPPDAPKDGLSIQDLLDPDYPDPLRLAIDRIEAAGFDANGLRVQYEAMKGHLRSCAAAFREIYHLARVRRIE